METIVVPARDLSDNLVASLFRTYMTTQNPFVGDILARHAPNTTAELSKPLASPMHLYAIEKAYQSELQQFTRGLMQAILDDSVIQLTQWGQLQTHRQDMVEQYMQANTAAWNEPLGQYQRDFYFEVLDPFSEHVSQWWNHSIRNSPWLMWYGAFTPDGSLVVEAGQDFRIAAWNSSHPNGLEPYREQLQHNPDSLLQDFDLINQACLNEANKHRFDVLSQEPVRRDPFQHLIESRRLSPMGSFTPNQHVSSNGQVKAWQDGVIVRLVRADAPELTPLERPGFLGVLDEATGPAPVVPQITLASRAPAEKAKPKPKKS